MVLATLSSSGCRQALSAVSPHALKPLRTLVRQQAQHPAHPPPATTRFFLASCDYILLQYRLPQALLSRLASLHADLDTDAIAELHDAIISDNEDDKHVWDLIASLVENVSRPRTSMTTTTPGTPGTPNPQTATLPVKDTPHRRSTNTPSHSTFSSTKSTTTHADIDPYLRDELRGHVFYDSDKFLDKFFPPNESTSRLFDDAVTSGLYSVDCKRWERWPTAAIQNDVLRWFEDVVNRKLLPKYFEMTAAKTQYTYGTSSVGVILGTDNQKLFPDVVISASYTDEFSISNCLDTRKRLPAQRRQHTTIPRHWWDQVRVIGELKSNDKVSNTASVIVQTAGYVRQIFQSQPNRMFVHAFTMCGDMLRAWIFDRSGCLGSKLVSINKEPELFLRVFCRYATMGAEDIGFDPTIRWIPRQVQNVQDLWLRSYNMLEEAVYDHTVAAAAHAKGYQWLDEYKKHSNESETPPIPYPFIYINAAPEISSSTSKTSDPSFNSGSQFAKTNVNPGNNQRTKLFLKSQAIFSSRAIVSRGTVIWAARTVDTPCANWNFAVKDQWRHTDRLSEATYWQAAQAVGVLNIAEYIYAEDLGSISAVVRRGLQKDNCKVIEDMEQGPLTPTTTDAITPGSSKRRLSEPSPEEAVSSKKQKSQKSAGSAPQLRVPITTASATFASQGRHLAQKVGNIALGSTDRQRSRLVMSPLGKDITKFQSFSELLLVIRDAIQGHRSLYQNAHILHRDISINNVLINPSTGGGFLIDLDLAINPDRLSASGAPHRTGTFDFMAIGIHNGAPHTYRHDLESFFWLLLYLCTYCPGPDPETHSHRAPLITNQAVKEKTIFQLIDHHVLDSTVIVAIKTQGVSKKQFEDKTLAKMHPLMRDMFGGLLMRWRDILFPLDGGSIWVGTPKDPDGLYDDMLEALALEIPIVESKERKMRGVARGT